MRARSIFDAAPHAVEEILLDHQHRKSKMWLESPFFHVISTHEELRRPLVAQDCLLDFPVLRDLQAEGVTDYLVAPLPLREGNADAASWCSDSPAGFDPIHVQSIRALSGIAGINMEAIRLRRKTDFERRLMDMKVDFMTTMAHEFRTPLSTVMVALDSLRAHAERMTPEQRATRLERIHRACNRLRQLIDEVVETGDANYSHGPVRPQLLNLSAMTLEAAQSQEINPVTQHHEVSVHHEGPDAVLMDASVWRHAVATLVDNAVKFSSDGQPIEIHIQIQDKTIELRVSDRGMGIPKREIPYVLSPFYRASNAEHTGGAGLGLTILNTRLKNLGGKLEIQSTLDEGTTVAVSLPIHAFALPPGLIPSSPPS